MSCAYADDAFLIAHFPAVVQTARGSWTVTVVEPVVSGEYAIEVNSVPYPAAAAVPPDTANTLRDKLKTAIAGQLLLAVSPLGTAGLVLNEAKAGTVDSVLPVVPGGGNLQIVQTVPQDNQAYRELWLDRTRCWIDPRWFCCSSVCAEFTLLHAAYTAWAISIFRNTDPSGLDATAFERVKLGPGEVWRGGGSGGQFRSFLQRNNYGELVVHLRTARVPTFLASGGPSTAYSARYGGTWKW